MLALFSNVEKGRILHRLRWLSLRMLLVLYVYAA